MDGGSRLIWFQILLRNIGLDIATIDKNPGDLWERRSKALHVLAKIFEEYVGPPKDPSFGPTIVVAVTSARV